MKFWSTCTVILLWFYVSSIRWELYCCESPSSSTSLAYDCLQVGAFAHGKIDATYVDEYISISEYPLSAAYAIGRITGAFEQKYAIV